MIYRYKRWSFDESYKNFIKTINHQSKNCPVSWKIFINIINKNTFYEELKRPFFTKKRDNSLTSLTIREVFNNFLF